MWPFFKGKDNEIPEGQPSEDLSVTCATANVLETRLHGSQKEERNGVKRFRGGAKVYVIDAYSGTCSDVTVIGHHRKSGRYIKIVMRAAHLTNFRLTSVYSPKVLSLLQEHYAHRGSSFYLSHDAEYFCKAAAEWAETNRREQVGAGNPLDAQ